HLPDPDAHVAASPGRSVGRHDVVEARLVDALPGGEVRRQPEEDRLVLLVETGDQLSITAENLHQYLGGLPGDEAHRGGQFGTVSGEKPRATEATLDLHREGSEAAFINPLIMPVPDRHP